MTLGFNIKLTKYLIISLFQLDNIILNIAQKKSFIKEIYNYFS